MMSHSLRAMPRALQRSQFVSPLGKRRGLDSSTQLRSTPLASAQAGTRIPDITRIKNEKFYSLSTKPAQISPPSSLTKWLSALGLGALVGTIVILAKDDSSAAEKRNGNNGNHSDRKVHVVVLTGGPCAGKSTALARIRDEMGAMGYHVFLVPEAATLLITGGAVINANDRDKLLQFEKTLIETQIDLEDRFKQLAYATGEKSIVICDRGVMDTAAYLPSDLMDSLLDDNNWSVVQLRDRRYDGVIHMVTAARGAEAFYTLSNNAARRETIEEARAIDEKLIQAWLGHHNHRIVNNADNFERKVMRTVEEICQIVGAPHPGSVEYRYLMKPDSFDVRKLDRPVQEFTVHIEYLKADDGVLTRLKKRSQAGASQYTMSQRVFDGSVFDKLFNRGDLISEYQIQSDEYLRLKEQRDPTRSPVKKYQKIFEYDGQIFTVNEYIQPEKLTILEVHSTGEVKIPPFLADSVIKTVSGDARYSSVGLSLHQERKDDM